MFNTQSCNIIIKFKKNIFKIGMNLLDPQSPLHLLLHQSCALLEALMSDSLIMREILQIIFLLLINILTVSDQMESLTVC